MQLRNRVKIALWSEARHPSVVSDIVEIRPPLLHFLHFIPAVVVLIEHVCADVSSVRHYCLRHIVSQKVCDGTTPKGVSSD